MSSQTVLHLFWENLQRQEEFYPKKITISKTTAEQATSSTTHSWQPGNRRICRQTELDGCATGNHQNILSRKKHLVIQLHWRWTEFIKRQHLKIQYRFYIIRYTGYAPLRWLLVGINWRHLQLQNPPLHQLCPVIIHSVAGMMNQWIMKSLGGKFRTLWEI